MAVSPGFQPVGVFIADRYRVLRRLGSGSMGAVYLVRDEQLRRNVALKILRTERLDPEGLAQIQGEFCAIASLHHPQLARAWDFGYTESKGLPFYTREYLEGSPIAGGPPPDPRRSPPREYLKPFFDLLDALDYLHAHEILHLDIHAGNLIVARDRSRGSVLIDFGLIRPRPGRGSSALVEVHSSMPPELLDDGPLGPAADLYSVGRLLLFRLTGSTDGEAKLPREIPGWGPRLTLDLERVLAKAIQRDPGRRFASAADFREALASALGAAGGPSPAPEPAEVTVGRDRELLAIEEALRRGAEGRAALFFFTGPRGIGKSRLLADARLRAQLRGLEVLMASFEAGGGPVLRDALGTLHGARREPPSWIACLAAEHGGSTAERCRRAAEAFFAEPGPALVLLVDGLEHAGREDRLLAAALMRECIRQEELDSLERGLVMFVASAGAPEGELGSAWMRRGLRRLGPLVARASMQLLSTLLRPLHAPRSLLLKLAREGHGNPLRMRQLARSVHREWQSSGAIPADAEIPEALLDPRGSASALAVRRDPVEEKVLEALAVLGRPASSKEVAAAAALSAEVAGKTLRALARQEVLLAHRRGRERLYRIAHGDAGAGLLRRLSPATVRRIHGRMVEFLAARKGADTACLENLARHRLAAGRREARRSVLDAVEALRCLGHLDRAVQLLGAAGGRERESKWRLRFAEEASVIHEHAGDHEEGIACLEPAHRGDFGPLSGPDSIRIRRRLGVHYHRAGFAEKALEAFREVKETAHPIRDIEELIMVDSELAELHTLRGDYAEAEKSCRRALDLLARLKEGGAFRVRMEVMVRATLGHLELRRMSLARAREELEAALAMARSPEASANRALILNNLGIVHNQLNDFDRAVAAFRGAEDLLSRAGERRVLIAIACNLATIAAKTGDAARAREQVERAERLLKLHPGRRSEFLVHLSRGMAAHFLGEMSVAASAIESALPAGRSLADGQFVGFAAVYLAEAQAACGRYSEALSALRAAAALPGSHAPVFQRMVASRLCFVEGLVGRFRAAASWKRALVDHPRTEVELLEAWSDLFLVWARAIGEDPGAFFSRESAVELERALEFFRRIGIPAGSGFAQVGLLHHALGRGDTQATRARLKEVETASCGAHKLLSVLAPLAAAEACAQLGEPERAEGHLSAAAGAIVGRPFLELDWRIEFLRARLSESRGDREGARLHVHRSLHIRDLLARSVPARLRRGFLAHPRLRALSSLASRLEKPRVTPAATPCGAGDFHGIIGRSAAMTGVIQTIERLRDQDAPVLITGETGTGKELVARAIHATGPRRSGPFFVLHSGSLPEELFESELFGYEAGAFTGAEEARPGLLEYLAGGTLLLDDVASLALRVQSKLLRVLESKVLRPLGSLKTRTVDVRVLASSSVSLEQAVAAGALRADFYFRLRGIAVHLPPLRSRREDMPLLTRHFLERHSRRLERARPTLTTPAIELLEAHDWPGNVRELEALLLRIVFTCSPGASIDAETVRRLLGTTGPSGSLFSEELVAGRDLKVLRKELDRVYLTRLFRDIAGDIGKMAAVLDVKVSRLYAWLRDVGIDIKALRREL